MTAHDYPRTHPWHVLSLGGKSDLELLAFANAYRHAGYGALADLALAILASRASEVVAALRAAADAEEARS